jgi:hypothetical protein
VLITNPTTEMPKIARNALRRILHCCTPPGLVSYRFTGEIDHNAARIVKSNYHTCHNENANGQALNLVTGSVFMKPHFFMWED